MARTRFYSPMRFPVRITVFFLTAFLFAAPARAVLPDHTAAKQAIMLDMETGQILFEKNADERMPTSSMSKTMTLYMVFEALEDGRIRLDTEFPVSEKAWRKGGSKMFVEEGKKVAVEDLIRGVAIQSGNDATIVLAEGLAGSEDAFAEVLTQKAHAMGMENSNFVNASGWPDPEHYSTARDLATLAVRLIRDFPDYYPYFSEKEYTFNNIPQANRNPLLYRNIGADGVKTGHTEDGGYGLIASGTRDGRRVVLVLNGMKDAKERAQEGARLLEWGLRGFENRTLLKAGETVTEAPVVLGREDTVPLIVDKRLRVTLPKTARNDLVVKATWTGPLKAPIRRGQALGTLHIATPRSGTFEVPLKAGTDVEKVGIFSGIPARLKLYATGAIPPFSVP